MSRIRRFLHLEAREDGALKASRSAYLELPESGERLEARLGQHGLELGLEAVLAVDVPGHWALGALAVALVVEEDLVGRRAVRALDVAVAHSRPSGRSQGSQVMAQTQPLRSQASGP